MAKRGWKIRELAKEIGVTSRVVIDRCRQEGVPVQNSATRLDPMLSNLVRSWFGVAPRSWLPTDDDPTGEIVDGSV